MGLTDSMVNFFLKKICIRDVKKLFLNAKRILYLYSTIVMLGRCDSVYPSLG
jgi:hypothetical protein